MIFGIWCRTARPAAALCGILGLVATGCGPDRAARPQADRQATAHAEAPAGPVGGADVEIGLSEEEMIRQLEAIGYLGATVPAPERQGITVHDPAHSAGGYNLFASGHANVAYLMAMDGTLLHAWCFDLWRAWPDYEETPEVAGPLKNWWRRVHLFENGDLLGIYEGVGLVKLDRESNLIWARRNLAHHDLDVGSDGRIYVLTRKAHVVPRFHPTNPILEDYVAVLDAEGNTLQEVSLLECLERSPYAPLLRDLHTEGDFLHTNTLEPIREAPPRGAEIFSPGRFLVSFREPNLIAVLDLEHEAIVWALSGMWSKQHEPRLLENGNLLLFDNLGHGGVAKVLEFDPLTHQPAWSWGEAPGQDLQSLYCGTAQRLANGNTVITESNGGRVMEVTRSGGIVWEYVSPYRMGDEVPRIATIPEMVRLPDSFPTGWTDPATVTACGG